MKKHILSILELNHDTHSAFLPILAVFSYIVSSFNSAVVICVLFMIIDFITGMSADKVNHIKFSKDKVMRGMVEKLFYFMMWIIAILFELLFKEFGPVIGISLKIPALNILAVIYIIGSEYASIRANYKEINMKMPRPLDNVAKKIDQAVNGESED